MLLGCGENGMLFIQYIIDNFDKSPQIIFTKFAIHQDEPRLFFMNEPNKKKVSFGTGKIGLFRLSGLWLSVGGYLSTLAATCSVFLVCWVWVLSGAGGMHERPDCQSQL